ncbi:YrhB domain-containing protein [Micromonospora sp. NPDC051925]|uniref:YrhB domain-containing protein n=1 Tax=Micromonospora sp. NPDC051925 TaxID=3364288 RepID=UPI0037C50F56
MNADRALARATVALRRIGENKPDEPLTLLPGAATERGWCWLFPFDTVRAAKTGNIMASLATGPLMVRCWPGTTTCGRTRSGTGWTTGHRATVTGTTWTGPAAAGC